MTNEHEWQFIDTYWEDLIVPSLAKYIEIPAKSPAFDPAWQENGYIEQALSLIERWVESREIKGLKKQVLREKDRTPLLVLTLPGELDYEVLMYGHLDKQPEMSGWEKDLGPWQAVRKGDKLYGRGGADDGYAVFASLCAIELLLQDQSPRPHIKVVIEASEESGSTDLPFYFENHASCFGKPELIICLDSGAGNYDQMWMTTSLRGLVNGTLHVEVLREGVHSGDASGVVPSSFRIARLLLDRLEDGATGQILPEDLFVEIPAIRKDEAKLAAAALSDMVYKKFPLVASMRPMSEDHAELILNRTWRPALSVIGAEGLPPLSAAGNVLRPKTSLKLSLRVPPTLAAKSAARRVKTLLEKDPPYGAKVHFEIEDAATGWNAPETLQSLKGHVQEASQRFFKREALSIGEGGSIPFMGMIGEAFPKAQFVITGVLGPNSNAHGPNEFIHIAYAKRLTGCVFHILKHAATK